ncbi:hypothetical protein [Emticicia sp. C21]|uniref:hypothetical protein n=1 Tax=Emticicia sp. C21 TaxID=2302915 RepID=UPI000E34F95F|nr:hypothetical protein [Emticicia sp. C21]RFS16577.1 hypothetical protein D0T08_07775 [Emticicia sp. C21]
MSSIDEKAFFRLFHEAHEKCFWKSLTTPLSETESKHFSNEILERTGLVVGWKSIKNYSLHILNPGTNKQENPSTATLDTFARYVTNAAKTDEANRKKNEAHFRYWYNYRDTYARSYSPKRKRRKHIFVYHFKFWDLIAIVVLLTTIAIYIYRNSIKSTNFTDHFKSVSQDSLAKKGWVLKNEDPIYWDKKDEKAGHLTLYTLDGDNYPDTAGRIGIKNLLLRKIPNSCFSTEIHLNNFIPQQNWQQVGILLMEDTTFTSKSVRLTLSFNNFFGGFTKPGEILLQAISAINGNLSKPEEIAHTVIFSTDSTQSAIVNKNLKKSALRIEKQNHTFRFLYATGENDIFAFKEIITRGLLIEPRYVGIFALKGFMPHTPAKPAHIDFFRLEEQACKD